MEKVIQHEGYVKEDPVSPDIGLIRVKKQFTAFYHGRKLAYIWPACLPLDTVYKLETKKFEEPLTVSFEKPATLFSCLKIQLFIKNF